ncbi:MAG: sulfatase-like hydrolase/transferase [Phycisphaerales bacterium]|nr:MAG: sulfatase-like hydrolase/transferase [Phycisphaerales bacterium]
MKKTILLTMAVIYLALGPQYTQSASVTPHAAFVHQSQYGVGSARSKTIHDAEHSILNAQNIIVMAPGTQIAQAAPVAAGAMSVHPSQSGGGSGDSKIIHDAEYYILEAQNGKKWAVEDGQLDKKLAELRRKYKNPPNIVHFMWDDQPFGAVGIPAMQEIRGYKTPSLNRMADEGMLFTRMYTEPSCTPSRAASLTGQLARRTGVYSVGFGIEYRGLAKETVTMAEVLSKVGYATGFYGKAHLGDIEESYMHNQGFDEAFVAVYNQVASLWNAKAEAVNATIGLKREMLADNPYELDKSFIQDGWILFYEGEKGGDTKEWRGTTNEDYAQFDLESQKRALAFMRKNAEKGKPFYVAWWPLWINFMPNPKKQTLQRGMVGESYLALDASAEALMQTLKDLGVAENTLVVAMADNGPMTHNPPPGAGLGSGPFRGGKGDFLEGGVRVCAQAWWPGMIEPGQIVSDMIHQTDLFTTFARLAGATEHIPTDRIIDGIDQTALLLNGDTHGRRDHVFIYVGPSLAATVKNHYKMHWISSDPLQIASGITAVFDLYNDHREVQPVIVGGFHFKEPFRRMRARHELWIEKYPHREEARGPAFTGISNARPETLALSKPPVNFKKLPFDPLEFIDHELPFDPSGEPAIGE